MNNVRFTIKKRIKQLMTSTLLVTTLFLGGCGEGSLQLADGIGGTGITMGRLTGFGSVYVNGIHFNTDQAQFVRDGNSTSTQSDFNVGEVIRVEGSVNADGKTGIADKVIYSDVIQGPVTQPAETKGKKLSVMGQVVTTDQLTVFHGFRKLADLKDSYIVEISGYSSANDNVSVHATSIKLLSETYNDGDVLEVDGVVSEHNIAAQTFRLNGITVNYAFAALTGLTHAELKNGSYLVVKARQNISNDTLTASELIKLDDILVTGVGYEIEGLVSYFLSSGYFEIDGYKVSTNTSTRFENGVAADIDENSLLIVTGTANGEGVIVAESVKLSDGMGGVNLEASLTDVNQVNDSIIILGQAIYVNNHTLLSDDTTDDFIELNLGEFNIGESVYIVAQKDGDGRYVASRLSRISGAEVFYVSGQPQAHNAVAKQLTLFGNTIMTNSETLYQDENFNDLSAEAFFSRIGNETHVSATGTQVSDGYILAESLVLEVDPSQ